MTVNVENAQVTFDVHQTGRTLTAYKDLLNLTRKLSIFQQVMLQFAHDLQEQIDAAVSGSLTIEDVQDNIGAILQDTTTIALIYDDATPKITANVRDGSISATKLDTAYLPAASYTAADVLAKLLTVDGVGSGIDADLLDGNSSAAYATAAHLHAQSDITDLVADLAAKQPLDADLTTLAANITAAGHALVDDADASAQRTTLGLGTIATQNANAVSISGGSITGITDLAIADGGTGASTAMAARVAILPSMVGATLKVVRVNAGETDIEYVTLAGGGDALVANPLSQFAATTSAQLEGVISDNTGTGALMFGTSPVITTDITIPNTGLHLLDTNASHDLIVKPGSDITADRTLTLTTGDADRTIIVIDTVQPDLVAAVIGADTAVNSTSDVTIFTKTITGLVAGDQLLLEGSFQILNNSGAARAYIITLDFDAAFDVELTSGAMAASATLEHICHFRADIDIRSTGLVYGTMVCEWELAAGRASGDDSTVAATHIRAAGWGTSGGDLTGSTDVTLKVRSGNATATQTFRLHRATVRKIRPL